jgi:hypothetical protein
VRRAGVALAPALALALVVGLCLLAPVRAVAGGDGAGHCAKPDPGPVLAPCGTGTDGAPGLSDDRTTCATVMIVNDTQYHVNLDPLHGPTHPGAPELDQLIRWIVREAPRDRENIAFVLQTGDLIQAVDRGGLSNNTPLHPNCLLPPVRGCAGAESLTSSKQNRCVPLATDPAQCDPIFEGCACWEHANLTREWDLLTTAWRKLDGVVPYAVVAGNHDNVGFLQGGGASDPMASRERKGFYQYFSPSQLDRALELFPGFERVDTLVLHEAQAGPEPELRGRGVSHAWRFRLGPYPVGVLGLDDQIADGADPGAALEWAKQKIGGELDRLPILAVSHAWFWNGRFGAPAQAKRAWKEIVAADAPHPYERRHKQVFLVAEGHHGPALHGAKDRHEGRADDDGFPVLHTRNLAGFYLIRFLFRSLEENVAALRDPGGAAMRDEVEILMFTGAGAPPRPLANGVRSTEWTRVFCEDFSIFYDDRDYDGIADSLDPAPTGADPEPAPASSP